MAPNPPFSTLEQIAILLQNLKALPGGFDENTVPTRAQVEILRDLISAQLLSAYASAGYYIPLQDYPDESWPEFQTQSLALQEAIGVAAIISDSLRPAPALRREGGGVNLFRLQWQQILDEIRKGQSGLRAKCYAGSIAEKSLTEPRSPRTNLTIEKADLENYQRLTDFTLRIKDRWETIVGTVDWSEFD